MYFSSERSLNDDKFCKSKQINDYINIQDPTNIQSVIKYTLFFNLLRPELII